jgi:hypothetical protein
LLAYITLFSVWFGREPYILRAWLLNPENKLYNAEGNVLIFVDRVDTGASDSRYPDIDTDA